MNVDEQFICITLNPYPFGRNVIFIKKYSTPTILQIVWAPATKSVCLRDKHTDTMSS